MFIYQSTDNTCFWIFTCFQVAILSNKILTFPISLKIFTEVSTYHCLPLIVRSDDDLASGTIYDHVPGTPCQVSSQCNGYDTGGAQCMQSICACTNGAASNGATCHQFNPAILLQVEHKFFILALYCRNLKSLIKDISNFSILKNIPKLIEKDRRKQRNERNALNNFLALKIHNFELIFYFYF